MALARTGLFCTVVPLASLVGNVAACSCPFHSTDQNVSPPARAVEDRALPCALMAL